MVTFRQYINETKFMTGYKVMRVEGNKIVAGADSRQKFPYPKVGSIIKMRGNGIYLGPSKDYVLDYYSGLSEKEILITFEFDPDDITTGNINDREWEITVPSAKVIQIEDVEE